MHPNDVLDFWIGPLDAEGLSNDTHAARWFRKDLAFDAEVRTRFEPTLRAIMEGACADWCDRPEGRLAYVIALDQFPRNMYRDTAAAFSGDKEALATARAGIEFGHDRLLRGVQRVFFYMPFMHAETLVDQNRSVALFTAFRDETSGKLQRGLADNVRFAEAHRDIIARWGRFPHRNAQLGRPSTPDELTFLQGPNSSF